MKTCARTGQPQTIVTCAGSWQLLAVPEYPLLKSCSGSHGYGGHAQRLQSAVSLRDTWRVPILLRFLRFLEALASPSLRRPSASPPLGSSGCSGAASRCSGGRFRSLLAPLWPPLGDPWALATAPDRRRGGRQTRPGPPTGAPSRLWLHLVAAESGPGAALGPKWCCKVLQSRSYS